MNEVIVILELIVSVITILSLWYLINRGIGFYKDKKIRKERERLAELARIRKERINKEKKEVDKRFNEWYRRHIINNIDDIEDEELEGSSYELYNDYIKYSYGNYSWRYHYPIKYVLDTKHLPNIIKEKYTYEI